MDRITSRGRSSPAPDICRLIRRRPRARASRPRSWRPTTGRTRSRRSHPRLRTMPARRTRRGGRPARRAWELAARQRPRAEPHPVRRDRLGDRRRTRRQPSAGRSPGDRTENHRATARRVCASHGGGVRDMHDQARGLRVRLGADPFGDSRTVHWVNPVFPLWAFVLSIHILRAAPKDEGEPA